MDAQSQGRVRLVLPTRNDDDDALQTRLTAPTKTKRNWGGTIAKLMSCAGVNTILE